MFFDQLIWCQGGYFTFALRSDMWTSLHWTFKPTKFPRPNHIVHAYFFMFHSLFALFVVSVYLSIGHRSIQTIDNN